MPPRKAKTQPTKPHTSTILDQTYELVPIGSLKRHPRNARRGDVGAISESIKVNGFYGALIAQKSTRFILAGNHRDMALFDVLKERVGKAADKTKVPVLWLDVDDDRALRILLVDNRSNDQATYNTTELAALLQEMASGSDVGLAGTGFTSEDLNDILAELDGKKKDRPEAPEPQIERAAELQKKWRTKPGQVWQIGPHRLMCGDSREDAHVRRLMAENRAHCIWSDPPYGVDYVGKTKSALTIENDSAKGLLELLTAAFKNANSATYPSMPFYIAAPSGPASFDFIDAIRAIAWRCHQVLVWKKDSMVLGHSDYHYIHESIFYGFTPGPGRPGRGDHKGSRWFGDNSQTSVFDIARPKRSEEHPTMKPPDLIAECLTNSTKPKNNVLDLFVGSGSTMVACEQLDRVCFGMDVDPKYVAVTLQRMADMGHKPVLTKS